MANIATNINKTNKHLSPKAIKHKHDHEVWRWKYRFCLRQVQQCDVLDWLIFGV
jgi:hypothetical protein